MVITFNGKEYKTMKELCNKLNLNYNTVICRRRNKPKETLDYWLYGKSRKPIVYNHKKYNDYKTLCKDVGIPYSNFMKSLNKIDEPNVKDIVERLLPSATYRGRVFKNYSELARFYGIKENSLHRYFHYHNDKTKDEVLDMILSRVVMYNDKSYRSFRALCRDLGINYSTFTARRRDHPDKGLHYWIRKDSNAQ